ncbi:MAG TPA: DUF6516 family protein [Pseudolabrys sp.]
MDAIEVENRQLGFGEQARAEFVIWRVLEPVRGSRHYFKYRLALIVDDVCVLRYDNEAGKGDHRHVDDREFEYVFSGIEALRRDFVLDARAWLARHADR